MAKKNNMTVEDQQNTEDRLPGDEDKSEQEVSEQVNPEQEGPAAEDGKEKKAEKKAEKKTSTFRVRSANPIKGESTAAFYFYTTDLKRREASVKMIDGVVQNMPQGCSVDDLVAAGFIRF